MYSLNKYLLNAYNVNETSENWNYDIEKENVPAPIKIIFSVGRQKIIKKILN